MPSLYIVLDRKIPGEDIGVDGNFLSKHNAELEKMANQLGVAPLMSFFSIPKEELLAAEEEFGIDLSEEAKSKNQKNGFLPSKAFAP